MILDEIHRIPSLFETLRGLVDEGRRNDKRFGRFLLLGSATIDLLQQSGESLAGRIEYVALNPLDSLELAPGAATVEKHWVRGGFPDSYLATSDKDSFSLRNSFIETYLQRDIPQFGPRIPAQTLRRLWTMLAHNQGGILNCSQLAAGLLVSLPTVVSYIDLLVDLLLVRRLGPVHSNLGKRLIRSPKVYIRDTGLLHSLLGISDCNSLCGHPVVGASWEGFVIENLLAVCPDGTESGFYRSSGGAEVDLVLNLPGFGQRWAIEIKRGASRPNKGFYVACQDLQPTHRFLVHQGQDNFPISHEVEAISVRGLAERLKTL